MGKPQCDPDKPPPGQEQHPPKWWCQDHPDKCAPTGPDQPNGQNPQALPQYAGTPPREWSF